MFHQMYMPECFNFDDFHPQETTYENVELSTEDTNLLSSLEEKQDFFDLAKSENRNLFV